jgi:polyhydroxybutyrate depolymerase
MLCLGGRVFVPAALVGALACGEATSTSATPTPMENTPATTGGGRAASVSAGSVASTGAGAGPEGPIGGDRPVVVHAPPSYDPSRPAPLLLLLHGYSASGALQELYLDLGTEAAARGYVFAHPNGTTDKTGLEFWNATDACCNFFDSKVDDSAYLAKVIAEIRQAFNVDGKRIYLMGHSNGGFMSHRMACEHADVIASNATLAGSQFEDQSLCTPSAAVSALVMHGTLDPVILYGGGNLFGHAYPSALATAEDWASHDGCPSAPTSAANLDLTLVPGAETKVTRWSGCHNGTSVEHWRIDGATHVPLFKASFKAALFDFFDAHPKP